MLGSWFISYLCTDQIVSDKENIEMGTLMLINKQPSFTVKKSTPAIGKINHVISVYLSLTGKTVRSSKLTFVS